MFPTVDQQEINMRHQDKRSTGFVTPHTVSLFSRFFLLSPCSLAPYLRRDLDLLCDHRYQIFSISSLQTFLFSECITRLLAIHTRRITVQVLRPRILLSKTHTTHFKMLNTLILLSKIHSSRFPILRTLIPLSRTHTTHFLTLNPLVLPRKRTWTWKWTSPFAYQLQLLQPSNLSPIRLLWTLQNLTS